MWRWEAEEPTSVRRTHPCFDRPLETIAWAMLSIVCSFRPVLLLSARHLNLFQLLQPRCAADQRVSKCGQSVSSGSAASEQRALAHVCGSGHCPARRRAPRPEAATAPRALSTGAPPWRSWPRLRWTPWSSSRQVRRLPAENCLVAHAHVHGRAPRHGEFYTYAGSSRGNFHILSIEVVWESSLGAGRARGSRAVRAVGARFSPCSATTS